MAVNTCAFVFPGQGSQKVGMLAAAHERFTAVRDTFSEASEALAYDMWDLIQNGEQEALNLTETTQPVLLTSSVALWRAWQEEDGARPAIMAGHSLGEFSALVCAGSLGFADAVRLVRQRGQFMQTAVPVGEGAMAAIIGLDDERINEICAATEGVVAAVNFNSPGQVVIAGHTAAVDAAIDSLKEAGAKPVFPARRILIDEIVLLQCNKKAPRCRLVETGQARQFRQPDIRSVRGEKFQQIQCFVDGLHDP